MGLYRGPAAATVARNGSAPGPCVLTAESEERCSYEYEELYFYEEQHVTPAECLGAEVDAADYPGPRRRGLRYVEGWGLY